MSHTKYHKFTKANVEPIGKYELLNFVEVGTNLTSAAYIDSSIYNLSSLTQNYNNDNFGLFAEFIEIDLNHDEKVEKVITNLSDIHSH